MFNKTSKIAAAVLIAMALAGCTTRIGDLNFVSTKNIDMSGIAEYKRTGTRVEGMDYKSIVIFIPVGHPNLEEAVDEAIEKVPGGIALVDAVITADQWYIPYIYGERGFIIEGDVMIDPRLAGR